MVILYSRKNVRYEEIIPSLSIFNTSELTLRSVKCLQEYTFRYLRLF